MPLCSTGCKGAQPNGTNALLTPLATRALQHVPSQSITAVEINTALHLAQAAVQQKRCGTAVCHLCATMSCRGPAGTAAGNIAFPKGKEIIISVFKRYRRILDEVVV